MDKLDQARKEGWDRLISHLVDFSHAAADDPDYWGDHAFDQLLLDLWSELPPEAQIHVHKKFREELLAAALKSDRWGKIVVGSCAEKCRGEKCDRVSCLSREQPCCYGDMPRLSRSEMNSLRKSNESR